MRVLIILMFIMFPLTGCLSQETKNLTSAAQTQGKAPDPNAWDFGTIDKNQIVKHEFEIKNNLSRILKINDVTTSCGCTASAAKKKVLAPGESTVIIVEFNSKGYKGETSQFVYVTTDDPQNPVYKFTFKVFVQ